MAQRSPSSRSLRTGTIRWLSIGWTELGLGVSRDPAKAISLYKQAAAHEVVPPDFSFAKTYLDKAAHHGDPRAAMLLGQMYGGGLGTTANTQESYAWSEVSVLEGSAAARQDRDSALKALGPEDQKAAITLAEALLADIKHARNSQMRKAERCNCPDDILGMYEHLTI